MPIGTLEKDLFDKYFSKKGSRFCKQILKNDLIHNYICYEIINPKYLEGGENGPNFKIISKCVPVSCKKIKSFLTKICYKKIIVKLLTLNDLVEVDGEISVKQFDDKEEEYYDI